MKKIATISLNKTFSVITDSSVSTHKYSEFVSEVSKFNAIVLTASWITIRQFKKYQEVLFKHGYALNNVMWFHEEEIQDNKVCTLRISYYKVGIATSEEISLTRK